MAKLPRQSRDFVVGHVIAHAVLTSMAEQLVGVLEIKDGAVQIGGRAVDAD
jgi:hypothetical protein